MRGWSLLFAASILAFVPSAQALSPTDVVHLRLPIDWKGAAADQADAVCVDVSSLWDDPTAIVVIAAQCTFTAKVSVRHTDDGRIVVEIVLYAVVVGQTVTICHTALNGPDGQPDVQTTRFYLDIDLIDTKPVCLT
jgi:hypothetical protein